ncbi:hypothetical protein JL720_16790 [Aureococcus anophagefferens]|nr:hypothetical protein JL720_16790 [Aureococcus anophagefferens]
MDAVDASTPLAAGPARRRWPAAARRRGAGPRRRLRRAGPDAAGPAAFVLAPDLVKSCLVAQVRATPAALPSPADNLATYGAVESCFDCVSLCIGQARSVAQTCAATGSGATEHDGLDADGPVAGGAAPDHDAPDHDAPDHDAPGEDGPNAASQ